MSEPKRRLKGLNEMPVRSRTLRQRYFASRTWIRTSLIGRIASGLLKLLVAAAALLLALRVLGYPLPRWLGL